MDAILNNLFCPRIKFAVKQTHTLIGFSKYIVFLANFLREKS